VLSKAVLNSTNGIHSTATNLLNETRLLPHPLSLANYQQIIEVYNTQAMGRPHNAQVTKLLI